MSTENSIQKLIKKYLELKPDYIELCRKVKTILQKMVGDYLKDDEFYILNKVKELSELIYEDSFSISLTQNPSNKIADLCSIKLIAFNKKDRNLLCDLIRDNFKVNRKVVSNNNKTLASIQKFDIPFFSIHLFSPTFYDNIDFPPELVKLSAEIQVRTILEHGWIENQKDISNNQRLMDSNIYKDELNQISTLIRTTDDSINSIKDKMEKYKRSYGTYMSKEEIDNEIKKLEKIYNFNEKDISVGYRMAKLAMERNQLKKSKSILKKLLNRAKKQNITLSEKASIMKDLGISICNSSDPIKQREEFEKGQKYLRKSIKIYGQDPDAYASLGGTYKKLEMHNEAKKWYKRALDVAPNDPYPLVNYLTYELRESQKPLQIINYHRNQILEAIQIRSDQIKALIDIPWANFDVGIFSLFLNKFKISFHNFLMGIRLSQHDWMIETTLNTLEKLGRVTTQLKGYDKIKILLLLGMYFHSALDSTDGAIINKLRENSKLRVNRANFNLPIVILSGGRDDILEEERATNIKKFIEAFKDFNGTIISYGMSKEINQITSALKKKYGETLRVIRYFPIKLQNSKEAHEDEIYETYYSSGKEFNILEALQYWYDLINSEIPNNKIKFLGLGGDEISELEYRMAATFRAQLGIIKNTGGAAANFINDKWWTNAIERGKKRSDKKLFNVIENKSDDIYDFLHSPFIRDVDIQNLRKLLIQEKNGVMMYEKDFSGVYLEGDLMSGLLTAVQQFAHEIGLGEIPSLTTKQGAVTMYSFSSGEYRAFVFLWNEPSGSLERKLKRFFKLCEEELEPELNQLPTGLTYSDDDKVAELLRRALGDEILKFFT